MIHSKHSPLRLPLTPAFKSLWGAQVLLGFMGTLFLLFAVALGQRADVWLGSIENHVIFELPHSLEDEDLTARVDLMSDLFSAISELDNISDIQKLDRSDIENRLDGWIDNLADLPLPIMIEAKALDNFNARNTKENLTSDFPALIIHEGEKAMEDGLSQVLLLKNIAYIMMFIVIFVGMAMSLTAAYWRLDVQASVIDLLHSMGASRRYIITDLARSNFLQTLASSALGLIIALILLAIIWLTSGDQSATNINLLSQNNLYVALFIPIVLAVVAGIATSWAVNLRYTAFLKHTE